MREIIQRERETVQEVVEETQQTMREPIDIKIRKEKWMVEDLLYQVMGGLNINNEEIVKGRINKVININRMGESEKKEQNRLINQEFKQIKQVLKQINELSVALDRRNNRMSEEMNQMIQKIGKTPVKSMKETKKIEQEWKQKNQL